MRHTAFAFACCLVAAGPASGAPGDVLTVTGNNVNVRSGPGVGHDVSQQVDRDQRLVEIERSGNWVHAEIEGSDGATGWIHSSLVALQAPATPEEQKPEDAPSAASGPAAGSSAALGEDALEPDADSTPAPDSIAPAAASEVDPADLQRFRESVDYLNSRALAVAGVELFTEVEPLGGGAVQVVTTEAWTGIPPAGQQSYANTLLDRWAAARGTGEVQVRIVDEDGQVLMEEGTP
jgi:hypothetical protein